MQIEAFKYKQKYIKTASEKYTTWNTQRNLYEPMFIIYTSQ